MPDPELTPASKEQLNGLFDHLEDALDARGYFRPAAKKPKMVDNLRAVLTRPAFTLSRRSASCAASSPRSTISRRKAPRGAGYPESASESRS